MNTAFVALDYIVDIMHPEGKVARSAAHASSRGVIAKANEGLAIARAKGWLVALVKVGFSPDYHEQPKGSPMFGRAHEFGALKLGEHGADFHPDLIIEPTDLIINKSRVSAFYGTALEPALRARKITRLIITGVSSTWAVQSTARDAHDRDYEVFILEDGCAAADEQDHQNSMQVLRSIAQMIDVEALRHLP
ncbi:isochorismatase [Bradyrhizobium sp. NAS80.1]|uniref:cysteine hydrolase family protein n=1 Tax=Bradyrhizobium sp. NAS80.1 TaxID=1680159 RepID=UPI00095CBE47|nr:isochorismatase family cysteine hydrolase [Bradyrhizobium sp. NAS80.1]OKO72657.1 isochorismatase [Bradyrhizobium sp. NAS80.1]